MSTVVFLHAHPDDEAIATAGTMAGLAADGHRVVLVTATGGELGEVPEGLLAEGETLAARRAVELGYRDFEWMSKDPDLEILQPCVALQKAMSLMTKARD